MEFDTGKNIITIKGHSLTVKSVPELKRSANLFYVVLFLWFIYLFAIRIFKVQTTLAFDWFMILLFGAVTVYYFISLIIWTVKRKQREKYDIMKITSADVIEKDENIYAVWQMQHQKFITVNFSKDTKTANALIAAIREVNNKISSIKK